MKISEFMYVKALGQGQFGMVHLTARQNNLGDIEEFAMKVVSKG